MTIEPLKYTLTTGEVLELTKPMSKEHLKTIRKDLGLIQSQMASYLCCSPRAIGYYESGERSIPALVPKWLAK